ncbi:S8 family peptidase [Deinococcus wulumuqiensis]|uniref:S8 family peptidase n=1 Tax=Deinococcus wulumuqiensis TaxID=980427 RepID=UPI00242F2A47|nr:S8 family serine peptidase [Deinococcus wulumuqiensis]
MRKPTKLLTLLGAALALSSASQASAGTLSPTLLQKARAGDQTPIGVIVRFNVANTGQGRALFKNLRGQLNSQIAKLGPSAGFLKQAVNSQKATQLWLDQSVYLPMTPVQARAVSQLPFVAAVFENFKVQVPRVAALNASAAPAGTPTHLQQIGAAQAWAAGFKGQGVRIGHLDSGIDPSHPELAGKVAAFQEFNGEGDRVSSQPHDTTDHGTHTAGLLVGSKVGVAPSAKVISALVLPNNEGTFAQVIAGMQYVLDPDNNADTDDGADVVNMSLGIPGTWNEFIVPVNNMLKAGVVPVFAIGNFGPASGSTGSPGNLPQAIGVGAVDASGKVASFSSRGPVAWQGEINGVFTKPDIAAPGVNVTSTVRNGGYAAMSGSSQASPITAGAVAVMLSAKPGSSVDAIKNALFTSASNAGAKNNNVGFGQISVPGALGKLGVNTGTPSQPTPPTTTPPTTTPPTTTPPMTTPPTTPTPPTPPAAKPTGPAGYTLCAVEGGRCTGALQKQVAFGTDGRWIGGLSTDDTFACTVAEWGQDPYPNRVKGCFIKGGAATPAPSTPTPNPAPSTPAPAQPLAPAGYTLCAPLGGTCKDATNREAAFGGAGRYIFGRSTDATFACTVAEWGRDPAPGVLKGCFLKNR